MRIRRNPRVINAYNTAHPAYNQGIQNSQEDLEIGYNVQVTKWLAMTPDFQYLWGVSTTRTQPSFANATVLSLQTRIAF